MKQNQYYNKHTMKCKLSEDGDYLCVYYLCFLDYVEISLTGYKDWSVTYYKPFKEITFYKV